MTFWEGWDDEKVWSKIDAALRKKKRKRFFIYFLFGTVIGIPILLSMLLNEKVNNFELTSANPLPTAVENKNRLVDCNFVTYSTSPTLAFKNIIKSTILEKTGVADDNQKIIFNKESKLISNKKYHGLNEFISSDNDRENSTTQISVSKEKFENLIYAPDNCYEVNNIPIYLTLIPESSKNKNNLMSWYKDAKLNICLTHSPKVLKKNNKSFLSLQYLSGIGIGKRIDYFGENIEWQELKRNNEKYLYSISHSLKISKTMHSNWNLSVGIGYVSHISKLNGINIHKEETIISSDSARYQNINGTNYYYKGNLVKTTTIRQNYDVVNSYSTYAIPFSISYLNQINNHQFLFGIGSQFNLFNEFKGYTYNEESKIEKINLLAKKNIHGSFGLNYLTTSIGYRRNIYSNFSFIAEMVYYIPLSPTYIQESPNTPVYKSNYTYSQLKLGVQYRLK